MQPDRTRKLPIEGLSRWLGPVKLSGMETRHQCSGGPA